MIIQSPLYIADGLIQLLPPLPQFRQPLFFAPYLLLNLFQLRLLLRKFPNAPGHEVFKLLRKGIPGLPVNELRQLV